MTSPATDRATVHTDVLNEARYLDEHAFASHVDTTAGRALRLGGRVVATTGFVCGFALFILARTDAFYVTPTVFSFLGGLFGLLLVVLAKRPLPRAAWFALMAAVASFPSLFFIVAQIVEVHGAATFITGPWIFLYAFGIVITGFRINPLLTLIIGGGVSLQVLGVYALARDELKALAVVAPVLGRDLSDDAVWVFRAAMFLAIAGATAGVARVARRLVARSVKEEREGQMVKKLFGQFVSPEVRDKILRERASLRSERVQMAVLFSDLRGFTSYSEKTDPAVVVQRLNAYFERMVLAIEQQGGVVDKFIGDAVMATFGGVVPLQSPASAAVRAAHGMRRALDELNTVWAAEGVPTFASGIGVHCGVAISGPLGSEHRREYTVIGDTVNTASRVEGLTKEFKCAVLVTQAVYDVLGDDEKNDMVSLGEATVKGRAEPLQLWGFRAQPQA